MRLRRIAVLAAAGLLTVANGFAAQAAGDDSVTVGTKSEAWYVSPAHDACEGDTDCSTAPTSEFPRNTLHVGISNGTPTTATYIELDVLGANVPFGATFTEGHVVLPVDMNPGDGSVRADQAKLRVCQTDSVSDTKASPDTPPDVNCDAASANARFSAKPSPTFRVDLAPFLRAWSDGTPAALAILPAPKAVKESETWHVTFFGKDYDSDQEPPDEPPAPPAPPADAAPLAEETSTPAPPDTEPPRQQEPKPITAELSYEEDEFTVPPPALDQPAEFAPPPLPSDPTPDPIDAPSPEIADAPSATQEAEPKPEDAPAPLAAAPDFITVGYKYPIAWLMPLLLLIGFAMTGHSLTRNLEHPARSLA
ncbi:hypothetical protein [Haloechinothrix halophila]|uniref:hypothetical protein n=1 Tax=Haloechinothrix halophila TaxID=1069073 RepID=UPI00054EEB14|nr:hypothetical protein [Haloechinothrix halophila]